MRGRITDMKVPWLVTGLLSGLGVAVLISPAMNTSHERFLATWGPFYFAGFGLWVGLILDLFRRPGRL